MRMHWAGFHKEAIREAFPLVNKSTSAGLHGAWFGLGKRAERWVLGAEGWHCYYNTVIGPLAS